MTGKVYFIGAGPGDPELITVKGKRLIESADVIIYAGSLVNRQVFDCRRKDSEVYDSAGMELDEIVSIMIKAAFSGRIVVRLHTGDPSIYGAVREQCVELEKVGVDYEIVPGVSSFTAAASVLKREFTVPEISQTVICTRISGRTVVPEKENLESLASHRASMAIFLSVGMIEDVVEKLLLHYDASTPAAVVQKATWEDEKRIVGTLADITKKTMDENIEKTALILVGEFLGDKSGQSNLYDKNFSHGYRKTKCDEA
jgi:precorrin-4/cobalt-precorrin-4 C11-methyltransferase